MSPRGTLDLKPTVLSAIAESICEEGELVG